VNPRSRPAGYRAQDRASRPNDSLQRLVDLAVATPCRVSPCAGCGSGGPRPGDDVYCAWVRPLPPDTGQAAGLYVIDRLWWGEATGDAVARSNHRALLRDYPGQFVGLHDVFDAAGLALPPDCRHHQLTTALAGLAEYPLYDEDDHTALTSELADQAWDAWLGHDVTARLSDDHGLHPDNTSAGDDELRDAFYRLYGDRFGDEYADTAVSVTFPHLDQAVALLADRLRAAAPG
jgi:hypothetical protein